MDTLRIEGLTETTVSDAAATHTRFFDVSNNDFTIMDRASINDERWFKSLRELYEEERDIAAKRIHPSLIIRHLQNQSPPYDNFDKIYAHSEQWLLYHLQEAVVKKNLARIHGLLPRGAVVSRVVLLIHTNRDACASCAQTISVFARRLQQYTREMHSPLNPLIIVSSRTGYLERRFTAGHDGHAANQVVVSDPSDLVKQVTFPDFPVQITHNTLE